MKVTENLVVPDPAKSIEEGAIQAWSDPVTTHTNRWKQSWASYYDEMIDDVAQGGGGNTRLNGNWVPTQYDTLCLISNATDWVELSRSAN